MTDFSRLKFDEQGLIPAVVQDWRDGSVLMLAFMNREALQKTVETKSVHFWSRSRKKLWEKGETSGNKLALKDLFVDCDGDTLLIKAEPAGPTCHTGERACFFSRLEGNGEKTQEAWGGIIERLYQTIQERKRQPSSDSYTSTLLQGGIDKVLKKVVEEAGEVVLAGKGGKKDEIVYETADLLFHTLVALGYHDIQPEEIYRELAKRFGKSGLRQAPAARAKEGTMGQNQQEQRRQTERREGEDRRGQSLNRQGAERRKIQSRRARADRRGRA